MKSTSTLQIMVLCVLTTCSIKSIFEECAASISETTECGSRECWSDLDDEMCTYRDWPQSLKPFHIISTFPPPNHFHIPLKGTVTLKMESACSFEISEHTYYPIHHKNLEDHHLPITDWHLHSKFHWWYQGGYWERIGIIDCSKCICIVI
jgi:hypothetical protein